VISADVSLKVAGDQFTFDPETHCYRMLGGQVVPSVTQALGAAGLIDFSMVDQEVLERKALLGKLVHQACHFYDENDLPEELPEEVAERLEGYKKFRAESGYRPERNEVRMIGMVHGIRYGMQFDSVGLLNGLPTLVDLKTGAQESPAWGVQLAGYSLGLSKPLHTGAYQRVVAHLKPGGRYKAHTYKDPGDAYIFIAALAIATWKQNHGIGV
jgi:hypothetical protein